MRRYDAQGTLLPVATLDSRRLPAAAVVPGHAARAATAADEARGKRRGKEGSTKEGRPLLKCMLAGWMCLCNYSRCHRAAST